ncbi:AAEL017392-PA [Aedes aegypti]|uniref:AAEL017392-PA n=1 Tax=Aedes aegypti TaxID=7159 RepID=J9HGK3_AEDAE|nr:AAEL017392-PA [Aedes aegypti]
MALYGLIESRILTTRRFTKRSTGRPTKT